MIPINPTQFRSALDCAVQDHAAYWDCVGYPADEVGDRVAIALWYSPKPATLPWLRCDIPDRGEPRYYISAGVPLDVWQAAEVMLP